MVLVAATYASIWNYDLDSVKKEDIAGIFLSIKIVSGGVWGISVYVHARVWNGAGGGGREGGKVFTD